MGRPDQTPQEDPHSRPVISGALVWVSRSGCPLPRVRPVLGRRVACTSLAPHRTPSAHRGASWLRWVGRPASEARDTQKEGLQDRPENVVF